MWMSTEDAKTDVILAGATAVLGLSLVFFLMKIPGYPHGGLVGTALFLFWMFALTGLVPLLLTRYRELGAESYGFEVGRDGLRAGLVLAIPIVVAGTLRGYPAQGSLLRAVLGRFSVFLPGSATIGGSPTGAASIVLTGMVELLTVAVVVAGTLLLYPFLTVRGREAFAATDIDLTQATRTFGMGAVASALVIGLLASIGSASSALRVLVQVLALTAFVLLGDRLVPARAATARAAVITPMVVAFLAVLVPLVGFDVLLGLYAGSVAAGFVAVMATIIEGRTYAWAVAPPVVAMAIYPPCVPMLPLGSAVFMC